MIRKNLLVCGLVFALLLGLTVTSQADTTYGRFQYYINGSDTDTPLLKQDGTPIQPSEVESLYGTPDGMTIYDDGVDICSWEYIPPKGLAKKKRPVYQDLSDAAGWPGIYLSPDTVAIDPTLGRFKVAEGDIGATNLSALPGDAEVILVWANPTYPDWSGTKIVRKVGSYPAGETDGTIVYDGTGMSVTDSGGLSNGIAYYYAAFAYDSLGKHSTSYDSARASATPQLGLASPNMLLNPGFEDGDTDGDGVGDNWTPFALSASDATFSLNNVIKQEGSYSQEIYLGQP